MDTEISDDDVILINELAKRFTSEQCIEQGIGFITRGLFRKAVHEGNIQGVIDSGASIVNVVNRLAESLVNGLKSG